MKTTFARVVCYSLIALAGAAAGGDRAAALLEHSQPGRQKGPAQDIERTMLTLVIKDGRYSMNAVRLGRAVEIGAGTYKADPSKQPATLDFAIGEGRMDEGEKLRGIYRLDGDRLTSAFADVGKDPRSTAKAGR